MLLQNKVEEYISNLLAGAFTVWTGASKKMSFLNEFCWGIGKFWAGSLWLLLNGKKNGSDIFGLGWVLSSSISMAPSSWLKLSILGALLSFEKEGIITGLWFNGAKWGVVRGNNVCWGGVSGPGDGDIGIKGITGVDCFCLPKMGLGCSRFTGTLTELDAAGLILGTGIRGSLSLLLEIMSWTPKTKKYHQIRTYLFQE